MLYNGDIISTADYENLIHIDPTFKLCFVNSDGAGIDYLFDSSYELTNIDVINFLDQAEILQNSILSQYKVS